MATENMTTTTYPLARRHDTLMNDERRPLLEPRTHSTNGDAVSPPAQLHKRITIRHWIVLLLACLLTFGNYYCYELPAAINPQLNKRLGLPYDTWQYQFNLLFTVASLPNLILPLLGGIAIDRFGSDTMLWVFTICVCLGQALFALGVSVRSFPLMVAGRFIFGIGGPSLEVAQGKVTTNWFKGRALAFALGLNLTFGRVATAANYNLSPWLDAIVGEVGVCWFGFALCVASGVCMVAMVSLDGEQSRRKGGVEVEEGFSEDEKFEWSKLRKFTPKFWMVCGICVALYGAIQPFMHISSDFFQQKWFPNDPLTAGAVQSIPDVLSSIASPLCGIYIDSYGHRGTILPLSGMAITLSHLILGLTRITPIIPLIIFGTAYSFFASALWPCIPVLVRPKQFGTAYGLCTVALNLALAVVPVGVAWLRDTSDWVAVEMGLAGLAAVGSLLGLVLYTMDWREGGKLERVDAEEWEEGEEEVEEERTA